MWRWIPTIGGEHFIIFTTFRYSYFSFKKKKNVINIPEYLSRLFRCMNGVPSRKKWAAQHTIHSIQASRRAQNSVGRRSESVLIFSRKKNIFLEMLYRNVQYTVTHKRWLEANRVCWRELSCLQLKLSGMFESIPNSSGVRRQISLYCVLLFVFLALVLINRWALNGSFWFYKSMMSSVRPIFKHTKIGKIAYKNSLFLNFVT